MNCKMAYIAYTVPLAMLYDKSDDIFLISKIHSRQLINFCFWHFSPKKKKFATSAKINYTINTPTLGSSKCRNNDLFICSDGWDIWEKRFAQKKWKKNKKKLWPSFTQKPIFFIFFIFSQDDSQATCQQKPLGIPSLKILLIFRNSFAASLVVLGGFDPLAPLEGDPDLYQIFYLNLDDLWWSPFVAS